MNADRKSTSDDASVVQAGIEAVDPAAGEQSAAATSSKRFAIAVSFPGEHREFVLEVVNELAKEFGQDQIFYDEWYEHELIGVNGDLKLRRYYREQAAMIVPFFSKHYQKPWCEIEWSAIRALMFEFRNEDCVIPVALDDTVIDGWERTDFAIRRKSRSAGDIAKVIVKAFRYREEIGRTADATAKLIHLSEDQLPEADQSGAKDLEKARNNGIKELKAAVVGILQSSKTREFILKRNHLDIELSAEDLATRIFAVDRCYSDDPNQYCTPMCFLKNCDPHDPRADKPPAAHQSEIYANLWSLATMLAPVSFQLDDDEQTRDLICKATQNASLDTKEPIIGGALVASFLGCPLDLDRRELIPREGDWHFSGPEMDGYNKVYTGAFPPVLTIDDQNLVAEVARGLAPQLGLGECTVDDVAVAVRELAGRRAYVCLWINRVLSKESVAKLHQAYPQLYVLMSRSKGGSRINSSVFYHIERLRKFVGAPV